MSPPTHSNLTSKFLQWLTLIPLIFAVGCDDDDEAVRPQISTIEEVRNLEAQWIRNYLSVEVDSFASLLDEEFVYSSERGVFRKDQYVANLASGEIEISVFENEEVQIVDHGKTAISYGISVLEAEFQGQDISGRDRFTRIWRNTSSGWKAVALHANVIPE